MGEAERSLAVWQGESLFHDKLVERWKRETEKIQVQKLTVAQVDAVFAALGLDDVQSRIAAKMVLEQNGLVTFDNVCPRCSQSVKQQG